MKRLILSYIIIVLLHVSLYAQQWEIDYGDAQSCTYCCNGIVNSEGDAVIVGGYASVYPDFHPIAMRVGPDGTHVEREYEGFDGLLLRDVVQLANGNYFAVGDFSKEAVGVMIFDANLEVVVAKRYERDGASLLVFGEKLLLDDDGTVVMSGSARYPSSYGGYDTRPCLYRFDENADTLRCRYVMADYPDPEYYLFQYKCHQILRNPQNDGLIFMGVGRNGKAALILYDRDFDYINNIWMDYGSITLFEEYSSSCWLSDDDLLIFGTLWPSSENERTIALLDVKLSEGGVARLDTIHGDSSSYHIACSDDYNTAFANDTTIYGSYYSTDNMYSGPFHPSVCLFNKDMEVLGNYVFYDEDHTNTVPCFILPQNDGGCVLVTMYSDGSTSHVAYGKIIKLSREDFDPIPCGVKERPEMERQCVVFPNPTSDVIRLDVSLLPADGDYLLCIFNTSGRTVMNRQFRSEGSQLTVDITSLKPGVYFYAVYNVKKRLFSGKLIKE